MNMTDFWDGTGVTVQALKAEVIKLGNEFPDNVVACVYSTESGEPVCIVGQAVYNITGKVVENEAWFGQINDGDKWVSALGGDSYEPQMGFTKDDYAAFRFVASVQLHQDQHNSWGAALAHAEALHNG